MNFLRKFMPLPFALLLIPVYGIQRGIAAMTKSGILPAEAILALSIYLFVVGFGLLLVGPLVDKFGPKPIILSGTILGVVCLGLVTYNFVLFVGVGLAFSAVMLRSATLAGVLKTYHKTEGYFVSPLAAAKNIGPAIFLTVAVPMSLLLGWQYMFYLMACVYAILGIWGYRAATDVPQYSFDFKVILTFRKSWKFWVIGASVTCMSFFVYQFFLDIVPLMVKFGIGMESAFFFLICSFWGAAVLRFPWAWVGEKIGHGKVIGVALVILVASVLFLRFNPILMLVFGSVAAAAFTPNYSVLWKHLFGAENVGTTIGFMYMFAAIGATTAPWVSIG